MYASWNGATEVAAWRLLAGTSRTLLRPEPAARPTAFETALALTGAPSHAVVEALDRHGGVLGRFAMIGL